MNYKDKIEEIKKEFWSRVLEVSPAAINSESISIVSDGDVDWLIEQAQRDAVEGLKVRQISGFQRDELGRWYKRYPTGMVLVTDEMLLDALNVRQENIDLINEYLNQTKEDK